MDFNARSIDEQLYIDNPVIDTMLELFLQEIDILFSTEKGSIFGNREWGLNIESFLWQTTFDAMYIQNVIKNEINNNCYTATEFQYSVNVELVKGSSKDIGVITIHIKNSENELVAQPQFIFK